MTKWVVEKGLLEKGHYWYKLKQEQRTVVGNDKVKWCWNFEYQMRKETTAQRPDVPIECTDRKLIQIIDMVCPRNQNINGKFQEKTEDSVIGLWDQREDTRIPCH